MQHKLANSWRDSARQPITSEPHLAATLGKIEHLDGLSRSTTGRSPYRPRCLLRLIPSLRTCSRQVLLASRRSRHEHRILTPWRQQRAQELIAVNQKQSALTILHEHVTSKRTRNSTIASLEPVVLLFVELCVELRKGKAAKDGLYNYKNTSQNTNIATIEVYLRNSAALSPPSLTHV